MKKTYVLIIDDDAQVRASALTCLRRPGFEFEAAADGRSGLARVKRLRPDIVICDVDMPGMNGFQLLEAVRKSPEMAHIRIMMLTRQASRASVRLGMTLGADDYLTKPFTDTELLAAFDELLSKRHRGEQMTPVAVQQHRVRSRVAYGIAAMAFVAAAGALYMWQRTTSDLDQAQHKLDRAANVAEGQLAPLLSGANKILRDTRAAAESALSASAASAESALSPDACRDLIGKLARLVPPNGDVGLVGANGLITCRSDSQEVGQFVGDRPHFVKARDTGKFAPGDYSIDAASGLPLLTSAIALKNAAGEFMGVAFVSQDIRPSAIAGNDAATAGSADGDAKAGAVEAGWQAPEKLDLAAGLGGAARQYLILFRVLTGVSLGLAGWAAGTFAKWAKLATMVFRH